MDWARAAAARRLAGGGGLLLEIGAGGLEAELAGAPLRVGIIAPGFRVLCDGEEIEAPVSFVPAAGARLTILPGRRGLWGYLAFGGAVENIKPVLGSYATHGRAGLASLDLQDGAVLTIRPADLLHSKMIKLADPCGAPPDALLITRAPQWAMFSPQAQALLCEAEWRISRRMDRMGYWLDGALLEMPSGYDIASEGAPLGSIEVIGSGQPVVLLADGQPTGGYPKIAVLARAALPHFVQLRAGDSVWFRETDIKTAAASYLALRQKIASIDIARQGGAD